MLSILVTFSLLEGGVRLLGYKPPEPVRMRSQPRVSEYDSILGWRLIPGTYELGPFNDIGDMMSITIKRDAGRVTRDHNFETGKDQITFIGGSFIMGHALDNDETMAWKMQEKFPHVDFRNLAVSAYGTYQSLMVLEDEFQKGNRPKCVIYGAFEHHALRNVADGDWLVERKRKIPYVTLKGNDTILRMGLIEMQKLWLSSESAVAFLAEKALNRMLSSQRVQDAQRLSHLLIKEMHDLCLKRQIDFYVAPLQYSPKEMSELLNFLNEHQIQYIDCNILLTKENIIKDDGHPNAEVNKLWADRIAARLQEDGIIE